ncbi:MAG: hypothetical protein QOI01_1301, partial [Mycobacterium sp.]|nr:hypothetical protein [Mycobacterium sp.]
LENLESGFDDGIGRTAYRQCDESACLDRFARNRGPNATGVRQVEQNGGRQHALTPRALQRGLGLRVVQKEKEDFFDDPRHATDRRSPGRASQEWYGVALISFTLTVLPLGTTYVRSSPTSASMIAPPSGDLGE